MKLTKFILPVIIVIGIVIYLSLFIVKEINQAIVLQFGDPKKNNLYTGSSSENSFYSECRVFRP